MLREILFIMKQKYFLLVMIGITFFSAQSLSAAEGDAANSTNKLVVVWSSDDPYVAEKVAFMYTHAAKRNGWFKEVTLIVWGPSAKLASENLKIQAKLKAMQKDGVVLEACSSCANSYKVAQDLRALGIDVKGMGVPLTNYLKSDAKVITF